MKTTEKQPFFAHGKKSNTDLFLWEKLLKLLK